jgi:hypothetical protein
MALTFHFVGIVSQLTKCSRFITVTATCLAAAYTATGVTENGWHKRPGKMGLTVLCRSDEITACGVPQKSVIHGENSESGV